MVGPELPCCFSALFSVNHCKHCAPTLCAAAALQVLWVAQNFLDDSAEEALGPGTAVLGLENQDDAGDPDFI